MFSGDEPYVFRFRLRCRTPIMIRWPGHVRPGIRSTLASSIDLAPTILAATGLKLPATLPGIDLLGEPSRRLAVYGEFFAHDVADIDKPPASLQSLWVRRVNHQEDDSSSFDTRPSTKRL